MEITSIRPSRLWPAHSLVVRYRSLEFSQFSRIAAALLLIGFVALLFVGQGMAAERAARSSETKRVETRAADVVPSDARTQESYYRDTDLPRRETAPGVSVWRMIFSLIFVVGLIILIGYVMRWMWAKGIRLDVRGHHMKVLDTLQLGYNRSVFLVQVGRRIVLLGSADKGVQYLTEITDVAEVESFLSDVEDSEAPAQEGPFSRHLINAMSRQLRSQPAKPVSFADRLKDRLSKMGPEPPEGPETGQ